jgi:hypothetical protein
MSKMFLTWQPKTHRNTMMFGKEAMLTNISVNLNCVYFKFPFTRNLAVLQRKTPYQYDESFFIKIQNITRANRKL